MRSFRCSSRGCDVGLGIDVQPVDVDPGVDAGPESSEVPRLVKARRELFLHASAYFILIIEQFDHGDSILFLHSIPSLYYSFHLGKTNSVNN